jgi:hypothetical protein
VRQLVIGFAGSMYAGKSTAAARLVSRFGFHRVRFAGPLKAMMAALGLSHEEIEGSLKETPSELLCGKTPQVGDAVDRHRMGPQPDRVRIVG